MTAPFDCGTLAARDAGLTKANVDRIGSAGALSGNGTLTDDAVDAGGITAPAIRGTALPRGNVGTSIGDIMRGERCAAAAPVLRFPARPYSITFLRFCKPPW